MTDQGEGAQAPLELPSAAGVNETWEVEPEVPRGIRGFLFRLVSSLLRPRFEAQKTFNSQQVQLDNALLEHLDWRSSATHAHYDRILGIHGRHIEEVDERHEALQKVLVAHFVDLVRRTELVRDETERGRLSLEHELKKLRRRVAGLGGLPTPRDQ